MARATSNRFGGPNSSRLMQVVGKLQSLDGNVTSSAHLGLTVWACAGDRSMVSYKELQTADNLARFACAVYAVAPVAENQCEPCCFKNGRAA